MTDTTGLEAIAKRLTEELASIDGEVRYHREALAEHEANATRLRGELDALGEAVRQQSGAES